MTDPTRPNRPRDKDSDSIPLRDYFTKVVSDLERHLDTKLDGLRREITNVAAMSDTAARVAREAALKAESAMERTNATVERLENVVDARTARSGGLRAGWGYLVGAVGIITAIISILVATR